MSKEDREKFEKVAKEREAQMKKNKELNDAYTAGTAAMESKDYDAAVTSLLKASELDPKQLAVWQHLAEAYVDSAAKKTGPEFDTAIAKGIENYGKALELSPSDAGTHSNLAIALGKAKKFPEASAETEKAAQLDPTKAGQFYYNLGASLVNAGQSEPAGQAFKKAVELDPNHADSHYQLGVILMAKASFAADGTVTPVAGTVDEFQKYLQLANAKGCKIDGTADPAQAGKAECQFVDPSIGMLKSMNTKVDMSYKNPNAAPAKKKK